jgi:hypothetical protein
MAEETKEKMVSVPSKMLTEIQEQMAAQDKKIADMEAKNAGLEELFQKGASTEGSEKLRQKKTFEPKFRTVRIRKFPIAGNEENLGYVVGWTNKGAYQEVDRSGISPQVVDYIDIIFHGQERTKEGKLKAEKVRLLDLFNKGVQVHCKILDVKKEPRQVPTGQEINVTTWDPQHGLVDTGEKVDGWVGFTDMTYTIQIPGIPDPVVIDALFVN